MGKRGRESTSDSSSEDERRSKNAKKERKQKKKGKKDKHKGEKHKEKGKGTTEDIVKQAKQYLKAHLGGGVVTSVSEQQPPVQLEKKLRISESDYFAKNNEFTVWLQEELSLFYNDLHSEQTRDLFAKFVRMWNDGKLQSKYYAGAVAPPIKRTAHTWQFKGAGGSGQSKGMAAFIEDQKTKKAEDQIFEKQEQRRWRADQKEQLDELLPKATGREGRIEQRMARRQDAKARESSPDNVRLPGGGDIYGGDDTLAAAKAREASRQSAQRNRHLLKHEEVSYRAAALQAKEDEKMAAFRAMVNAGPIQIKKRE